MPAVGILRLKYTLLPQGISLLKIQQRTIKGTRLTYTTTADHFAFVIKLAKFASLHITIIVKSKEQSSLNLCICIEANSEQQACRLPLRSP